MGFIFKKRAAPELEAVKNILCIAIAIALCSARRWLWPGLRFLHLFEQGRPVTRFLPRCPCRPHLRCFSSTAKARRLKNVCKSSKLPDSSPTQCLKVQSGAGKKKRTGRGQLNQNDYKPSIPDSNTNETKMAASRATSHQNQPMPRRFARCLNWLLQSQRRSQRCIHAVHVLQMPKFSSNRFVQDCRQIVRHHD